MLPADETDYIFSSFFVLFGALILGTIVSTVGGKLLERQESLASYIVLELSIRWQLCSSSIMEFIRRFRKGSNHDA